MRPVRNDTKGPPVRGLSVSHIPGNVRKRKGTVDTKEDNLRMCHVMKSNSTITIKRNHVIDHKLINSLKDYLN